MEKKFKSIDKNEILKYLNYQGQPADDQVEGLIAESLEILEEEARPKSSYQVFNREDPRLIPILVGQDIQDLLKDSHEVILMAVTLGVEPDKRTRMLSYSQLALSLVLDATASAAIEAKANDLNDSLAVQARPDYLTDRYSPGYGDLDIGVQEDLLNLIDAKKKIGLTCNESGIMLPRKSITAIIGISQYPQTHRGAACDKCRLSADCPIRKRGDYCGKRK